MTFEFFRRQKEYAPGRNADNIHLVTTEIPRLTNAREISQAKNRLDTILIQLHSDTSQTRDVEEVDKMRDEVRGLLATLKASGVDISRYNVS
jgi:hypothetical protein